jgi:hypothetical protein
MDVDAGHISTTMNTKNTGGPAFPIGSGDMRDPTGMTLRDYFAAQAMTRELDRIDPAYFESFARRCWMLADAMLKTREE